ncbi:hypothetical protein BUALT_Bualt09G0095900 [Buddleja alternifolia]|uniref:NAC domain-containing protein n=1 Tax=Buddleja alternifolia TaxID=168488 RepID=A0AAV6X8J7_9LAMI|nr:hypothetical protein BUALT_Bualt09G0095900 [Buddleja alternifolia]
MLNGTRPELHRVIPLLHIYDYNPWDLPQYAGARCGADNEQWFFFIPRQEREARGGRPNRLTSDGYWKATGSPSDVYSSQNRVIGRKRTMVFYVGRAPNGRKTVWKMNEYKAVHVQSTIDHEQASSSSSSISATPQLREDFSLCRIYKKSKCLRAFDRRPTSEAARNDVGAAVQHRHHRNETATSLNYQHNPTLVPPDHNTIGNSLDSSSSGDQIMITNNNTSQSVDSGNNPEIAVENDEQFWDSEEFDWIDYEM